MPKIKPLEALIQRAAALPEEAQDELADAMSEAMQELEAKQAARYRLSEGERAGIERGLEAMRDGRFARDERMAAIFRRARVARA